MTKNIILRFSISLIIIFSYQFNFAQKATKVDTVYFLQTNDTHSRIEAFSENEKRNPGAAGYAMRSAFIKFYKEKHSNLLIFDSGDFLQGTPYFNFFKGELEVELMNRLGYHAVTLGNHEFDNGVDELARILKHAKFKVISSNYDVSKTALRKIVKPYHIFNLNGIRIGVIGLGVDPEGLISPNNFKDVVYKDPIEMGNYWADYLKEKRKVAMVVCLSHLGFYVDEEKISDATLAASSKNIDIIMGGHSHVLIDVPLYVNDKNNNEVLITQNASTGSHMSLIYSVLK
ncbi:MAG: bifunctional metallophosphatase/5'-nucleotidase [Bacteroidales bacterium]|jgi:5'-nucleotidase|nr:bifunctional metallophosphatase/5'-nucleotidase [Bacteroidales bacterium]